MDFILVQTLIQSYNFLLSHKHTWQSKYAERDTFFLSVSKASLHDGKIKKESWDNYLEIYFSKYAIKDKIRSRALIIQSSVYINTF